MSVECFICDAEIYSGLELKPLDEIFKIYGDKCKNCGHPFTNPAKEILVKRLSDGKQFKIENSTETKSKTPKKQQWWRARNVMPKL